MNNIEINIRKQIEDAKEELAIAEQNLNYVDDEFLDVAIHDFNAKKIKLNALLSLAKKEGAHE